MSEHECDHGAPPAGSDPPRPRWFTVARWFSSQHFPVVAAELAIEPPLVTPETPAAEAAALLTAGWEELVVVSSQKDRIPRGLVTRQDMLKATHQLALEPPRTPAEDHSAASA